MSLIEHDDILVERAQGGDHGAFETLMRRYQPRTIRLIYGIVRNIEDARDLSQDAFMKAYARLDSYRAGTSFHGWIAAIARNGAFDFLRRRKARQEVGVERLESEPDGGPSPLELVEFEELWERFCDEFRRLPPSERLVIRLRVFKKMSHEQIAEKIGKKVGTARWLLHKARKRLQSRMGDLLPERLRLPVERCPNKENGSHYHKTRRQRSVHPNQNTHERKPTMFTVANRIYVDSKYRDAFEDRFKNRARLVDEMPGFVLSYVMRPVQEEDPYIVFTVWQSRSDFENWVDSDAFKKGHARSGTLPKEAFTKPNKLELHELLFDSSTPTEKPDANAPGENHDPS